MRPLRKSSRTIVHRNPWNTVYHVEAEFGAFCKDYWVNVFGPRAGVVAVRDGRVLLVRQYRLLIDGDSLEIPGGKVEDGEAPEDAVARECLEESRVRVRGLRPLVVYYPGLDNVENRTTLFFSEDVEDLGGFVPDPKEILERVWLPFEESLERVFSGEITDALTVVGLLGYGCSLRAGSGRG